MELVSGDASSLAPTLPPESDGSDDSLSNKTELPFRMIISSSNIAAFLGKLYC